MYEITPPFEDAYSGNSDPVVAEDDETNNTLFIESWKAYFSVILIVPFKFVSISCPEFWTPALLINISIFSISGRGDEKISTT